MRLIQACQYKISKLIRPGFIDRVLNAKDLMLVNYESGNAKMMLTSEVVGDKKFILLYFSAHWCPPCRKFTPILVDGYKNSTKTNYEIIFVTHDRSEQEYTD